MDLLLTRQCLEGISEELRSEELSTQYFVARNREIFYMGEAYQSYKVYHFEDSTEVLYKYSLYNNFNDEAKKDFNRPRFEIGDKFKRLAKKLERNVVLIMQLELAVRGIMQNLTRDRSLPGLVELFTEYNPVFAEYRDDKRIVMIRDNDSLLKLGAILIVATIQPTVLLIGPRITAILNLILELATEVGFPEDFIKVITANYRHRMPYTSTPNHMEFGTIVVFSDANFRLAAESVFRAVWGFEGQICKTRHIYVERCIEETFLAHIGHIHGNTPKMVNYPQSSIDVFVVNRHQPEFPPGIPRAVESCMLTVRLFDTIDEIAPQIHERNYPHVCIWSSNTSFQFHEFAMNLDCWSIWWNNCYGEILPAFYVEKQFFNFDERIKTDWAIQPMENRIQKFRSILDDPKLDEIVLDGVKKAIHLYVEGIIRYRRVCYFKNREAEINVDYKVETFYRAVGTFIISKELHETDAVETLLCALLFGNDIIIIREFDNMRHLKDIKKHFPDDECVLVKSFRELDLRNTRVLKNKQHLMVVSQWKNVWTSPKTYGRAF